MVFFLYIRNSAIEGKIYHLTRATSAFRGNFPDVISDALVFRPQGIWGQVPTRESKKDQNTILYRVFSHDVTAAILVSQDNETAAMLVSQTNPLGV